MYYNTLIQKDIYEHVNENEKLFNMTLKTQIKVKEQYFYCCSTFHSHNRIFNSYPKNQYLTPLSSNLNQGEVYNIMCKSLSVTYDRSAVSSTNKTDCQDITEILLKEVVNTIKQTNIIPLNKMSVKWTLAC